MAAISTTSCQPVPDGPAVDQPSQMSATAMLTKNGLITARSSMTLAGRSAAVIGRHLLHPCGRVVATRADTVGLTVDVWRREVRS